MNFMIVPDKKKYFHYYNYRPFSFVLPFFMVGVVVVAVDFVFLVVAIIAFLFAFIVVVFVAIVVVVELIIGLIMSLLRTRLSPNTINPA